MATRARHFEAALAGFRDNSGNSLSGGKLQFYVPGTSTAKNAYTDRDKTEPVTEVTLDSNGRAEVFGDGWYDIKLLDASGSTLATFEYVYLQRSAFTVETKTADFTASTDVDVYLVDTTNGNVTVSYPTAENIEYPIEIAKKTADANTVTIDPYGSETINGESSFVLDTQNQSVKVASDGANLYTLGAFVNTAVTITTEATTAVKGKTRYATDAETVTGSEAAAATTPASVNAAYGRLFKAYHEGLIISNNGTDAAHDIDISAGLCRNADNDGFIQLSAAITKQIDAAWTAGTNAGGFPSGLTLTASTYYRVFLIHDVTNGLVDAGFDTDASATNLLADATDYTEYRQIGWIRTDTGPDIVKFFHVGDGFYLWDVPVEDVDYSTTMPTTRTAVVVSAPPGTIAALKLGIEVTTGSGQVNGLILDSRQTDTAPSTSVWNLVMNRSSSDWDRAMCSYDVLTDASSQIYVRFSSAQKYGIATTGFKYLWD